MRLAIAILLAATSVQAGEFIRVFVDTNNAATLQRVVSFNTAEPFASGEIARLPLNTSLPAPEPFLEWDGSQLVPMGAAASNALAASIAAAASNATYLASLPAQFPNGIEADSVILISHTNELGIALEATDEGDLFTFVYHASPIDFEQVRSNRQAALSTRSTLKSDLRDIRLQVTNSIAEVDTNIGQSQAIVVSGTSTTAQVRSAVVDLRREQIDQGQELKAALRELNRLRKVVAEMVKENDR